MAPWMQRLLAAALLTLCSVATHAGERVTTGRVRFITGVEEPQLIITLGSNPAVLEPIPDVTDAQALAAYQARMLQYADWPLKPVEIRIPLPEYGSAANFDNAYISRGAGVSFDAGYYASANAVRYAGAVTLTEFTRDVLAGHYNASLYSAEKPKQPKFVESVSGWFRISSPVQHDPRANRELSEGERVRVSASAVWQTLNGVGLGLDDAETFASSGGSVGGIPSRAQAHVAECVCECDVLIRLPQNDACIQPDGDCYAALQICHDYGLDQVTPAAAADVEEILDYTVGKNAPETTRSAMRASVEQMSPEERAKTLEGLRQGAAQVPGSQPQLPPELQQVQSALDSPTAVTPSGAVPVNPDWDAETLRYKAAVEQLGLPPDIVEDAVENFHNNEAPIRSTLWENLERLRKNKQE